MDDEFLNAKLEADEKKKTEELLERLTHLEMPSDFMEMTWHDMRAEMRGVETI